MRIFKTLGHVRKKKEQDESTAEEHSSRSLFQGARQDAHKYTLSTGRERSFSWPAPPCADPRGPSSPPLSHGLTQQSGCWGWRHDKPSPALRPAVLGKVNEEFSEVEG